jgi:hypothetical protein
MRDRPIATNLPNAGQHYIEKYGYVPMPLVVVKPSARNSAGNVMEFVRLFFFSIYMN